ncbi:opsin-like protein [Aaosphaeria arxii CBS 175.79]|uniref:Opsin-like protein n=1 Tax=Aaosphaeria arxii CBS 175.79 TaxID=1450172 RepID=A0A6A5XCN7_9PLEO|nr:opsin-like protein [Aaosphaeria arxii CBS 175.79]KAF2010738.1 opsin-like protein [Aaosphaeria arxii CBS 175.79]
MDSIEARRNDAVRINNNFVNGRLAEIAITRRGSDFYFAICAIMTVAAMAFIGLAFTKHRRDRIFHYITAAIVLVAAIAYFTMGSNLGFTPIAVEFRRSNPKVRGLYREIFYVRYIDWFITTPLLLMDLLLTAGMPWPTILWVILIDEVMIVTGLIGALVRSSYKWGYFTFGCAALFYILYQLVWEARRHSSILGDDVRRVFFYCGSLTALLWTLYPIAWGVCEGGNIIAPDSEAVFYGILDFLAKPVFGALLIWGHRNIDPARLGLAIRDYEDDPSYRGGTQGLHEKHGATNGHTNGVHAAPGTTNSVTNGVHATEHPEPTTGVTSGYHTAPGTVTTGTGAPPAQVANTTV